MATSGTVTYSLDARQIITYALGKIGVLAQGEAPDAAQAAGALVELNLILKEWAFHGPWLSTKREGTATAVADTASYALSDNPVRVLDVRWRDANGNDLPMTALSREGYYDLPDKSVNGVPTSYFFDPQRAAQTLYVWPYPLTVTTETYRFTYQRRIEDVTSLDDDLDIPQEQLSMVGFVLASRLCDDYSLGDPVTQRIRERAASLMQAAQDFERPDFVTMTAGGAYGSGGRYGRY